MPPLPPAHLVLDALRQDALPAAGGAALVMCLFLVLGRWAGALGSAAAVIVGFAWANHTFEVGWENTGRLIPWTPGRYVWHWLPRAAVLLIGVGLVSRWGGLLAGRFLPERRWWVANLLVWVPRWAAVVVVSAWLVPTQAADLAWVRPALATVMLLSWIALDGVARFGAGGQVAAYQTAMFLAAAAVLIHHHWGGAMELAVVLGCAMFGIAVAAGAIKSDTSGAVPATVGFLPGLMLSGRVQVDSPVPLASFWLVALAPLTLLPFTLPWVQRQNRWVVIPLRTLLVLTPLVVAVILAMQHEPLAFDEE
jgi:hypothetical protein